MQKVKVPPSQILWLTKCDSKGNPLWALTSDAARMKYYLYRIEGEKAVKVKVGKSPVDFEEEIGKV